MLHSPQRLRFEIDNVQRLEVVQGRASGLYALEVQKYCGEVLPSHLRVLRSYYALVRA